MVLSSANAVYPTQQRPLQATIERLLAASNSPVVDGRIHAVIVPDSNLLSGAATAAAVYQGIREEHFDNVIIIAPSHSGGFGRIHVCSLDQYRTPLGDVTVDDRIREELCDEDDDIYLDDVGHFHTSGVDVQLPFLQMLFPKITVVPIVMGEESTAFCRELGSAVGEVMYNRSTLVVACVDILGGTEDGMNELAKALEACDVDRVIRLVNTEEVVVVGKGAMIVAMLAALQRRANNMTVIELKPPVDPTPGRIGAILARV